MDQRHNKPDGGMGGAQVDRGIPFEMMCGGFLTRDRVCVYGDIVHQRDSAGMGMGSKPGAPASPWQNGFAERLIGSIRSRVLGSSHRAG